MTHILLYFKVVTKSATLEVTAVSRATAAEEATTMTPIQAAGEEGEATMTPIPVAVTTSPMTTTIVVATTTSTTITTPRRDTAVWPMTMVTARAGTPPAASLAPTVTPHPTSSASMSRRPCTSLRPTSALKRSASPFSPPAAGMSRPREKVESFGNMSDVSGKFENDMCAREN